jgi:hypothetical protein
VRAVVRQAIRDIRTAPPPPPVGPPADPVIAKLRAVADELAASAYAIGELMLEVASAYLSDTDATDILALLCEQIGEPLDHGLAARRYALTGDRRALSRLRLSCVGLPLSAARTHTRCIAPGGHRYGSCHVR